jgi:hypothetical protein
MPNNKGGARYYTHTLSHTLYYTASKLSKLQCVYTDLESDPDAVRDEFNKFLTSLLVNWKDNQERVEQGIVSTH